MKTYIIESWNKRCERHINYFSSEKAAEEFGKAAAIPDYYNIIVMKRLEGNKQLFPTYVKHIKTAKK